MSENQDIASDDTGLSFAAFRAMFHYADHADMQFKFLKHFSDADGTAAIAAVFKAVGATLDTGDVTELHRVVQRLQVDASHIPKPDVHPEPSEIPFAALTKPLADVELELLTAGGVFAVGDDPMGPDGPSQDDSLGLITEFLRGVPTLSVIPAETPDDRLTARHPGYDAKTAQRDPNTVFPLSILREISADGHVGIAKNHGSFTGATSFGRLKKEVAPAWAADYVARDVDAVLLVAT